MSEMAASDIKHRLYAPLIEALGPSGMILDPQKIAPMTKSWRDNWISEPALVVQPASTAEVQAVIRICLEADVPVVPQGGNTGVTGAGLTRAGGKEVLLSLRRLNKIRAIDLDDNMMVVESGCILQAVKEAAEKMGRLFPMSLGAAGSCTIGGNISTNAGGLNALRYGSMRDLVAGLEVVMADGRVWNGLKLLRKDNAGYDLKQLFIGAEGTLGIITAAVLKLSTLPTRSAAAIVAVESPRHALAWLRRLLARFGNALSACELIERTCIEIARLHYPETIDPFNERHPWYVLVEVSELNRNIEIEIAISEVFGEAAKVSEVLDGVIATSKSQSEALWRLREAIPEAQRREGISFKHDISVPVSRVPEFIDKAQKSLVIRFPGIRSFAFGHLGDGNIHFNPIQARGEPVEIWHPRLAEVNRIIHDIAVELGGSITAEHGIGQLRRAELVHYKSKIDLDLMQSVKNALDPQGILNPGKIFLNNEEAWGCS